MIKSPYFYVLREWNGAWLWVGTYNTQADAARAVQALYENCWNRPQEYEPCFRISQNYWN